ncbi:hypothetical protein A6U86_05635 [Rhizobium sp. AC27/96]|uniref:hypothetical protein n=1 Tax=Rhizobium sp. AC27/96 TaxID=1841653 RepID=UPI000828534C|nr:hypothetical protein [Rhizobium sp. AC27/96]OCJ12504.1 hypothetical protein A6U86_05635 [Rhizobium sp. AC27/96]
MADGKTIDDGGLAFTGKRWEQVGTVADHGFDDDTPTFDFVPHPGMTLRDWFAGQALAGEFAAQNDITGEITNNTSDEWMLDRAKALYRMADAMIAARKGGAA